MIAALVNGADIEVCGLISTNILQETVPQEKLGWVSSVEIPGTFVLLPLGFAFTGRIIDRVDVALVFVTAGLVAAAVSLIPLPQSSIRILD